MTLSDKIITLNRIDAELASQLSEMSYRAINGTRQEPRNFREGILNVGTINFKTAEDKITKEMIMEYQKNEEEKFFIDPTGNKVLYDQTGLTDSLSTYTSIPYGATGTEATEADLRKENDKLSNLVSKTKPSLMNKLKRAKEILDIINGRLLEYAKDPVTNAANITKSQAQKTKQEADILKLEGDRKTLEKDLTDQDLKVKQVKDNIEKNKVGRENNDIENNKIAKKYQETFNYLNRNRSTVNQDPNESDANFIARIKSLETLAFDPNIYKQKAASEEISKFMDNLKNITRDEVKISDIVKTFTKPEDVFIINNNWPIILNQLKTKFGINNPNITVGEYSTEIIDVMDTLINKPFGTTIAPPSASTATITRTYTAAAPIGPTNPLMDTTTTPPSPTDFDFAVEDNSLFIRNKVLGKQIYIKIAQKNGKKILFSDTTNEENKFRAFNKLIKPLVFSTVLKELGANKNILNMIFGISTTLPDKYDFIANTYGLTDVTGKSFFDEGRPMVGWGIKQNEIPQYTMFGKNIILYNKLYYKNVLAIKDKKGHSVEHFKNVKVSDKLAEIIINMIENIQPTKQNLDSLKTSERQLFDLLIYVSGLSKKINTKKDDNIDELKERLKLVEAQIRSGNDNPIVKKELEDIVKKLQLYNCISMNNAKDYLKQFI